MAAATTPFGGLSTEQVAEFNRNGFLTIPGWFGGATIASLNAAATRILDECDPTTVSVFSTDEHHHLARDTYFLESGDKVRCFFEEHAFADDGSLKQDKHLSINKAGHDLHTKIPEFRDVSLCPETAAVCRSLGYAHPLVVQSMVIYKQPRIGGDVAPHVDGAFLYTEPQSCVGLWWPLEDCTVTNGCLWAVPGSHKEPVKRRFRRNAAGTGTEFYPAAPVAFSTEGAVPLEIAAGTLVVLHNSLVHYSARNSSDRSRHAYSIHIVEGAEGWKYPADNWLQRTDGTPFPALY